LKCLGKECRKTKEYLERYSEEGFGAIMSGLECGIGSKKMEKDHYKSALLKRKIWTLNENDDDIV